MKLTAYSSKLKVILILSTVYFLLSTFLSGCATFRRKFVRKAQREKEIKVVVATQEYEATSSPLQAYKTYLLFWRAAHDELMILVEAQEEGNHKKMVSLAKRIVENLAQMRVFLIAEKQNKLDAYILTQKEIEKELNTYSLSRAQLLSIKSILKKQKRAILQEFTSPDIQEYIINK